ncbi:MAG: polynucleotide adenylyltransferase PcnB, partial [Burkholderiales bacterium]|nr:polynucleotide adenylyltransferase PcnB [Burkholderiales bacterium]
LGTIVQNVQNFLGKRTARKKPVVIPKREHNINLRNVSGYAIQVCRQLKEEGYSAFIVGGAVRDLLIGHRPKDFDVATDATPEEVRRIIKRSVIIGKRFRLVHAIKGSETIEISTFRANDDEGVQKDEEGRVVADNVYGEQHEDASRRDFTINAMYYDPTTEEVYDYHNGLRDIRNKVVRMIGSPAARFREDPVRILRAIRISAKLGFKIDPAMIKEMPKMQHLLQNVPESRLVDEILKMMMSGAAIECIKELKECGITEDLPLMEPIRNPASWPMIKAGLEKTDARIKAFKPVSSSFVFAFLLWHLFREAAKKIKDENPELTPARIMADAVKAVFASGAARGLMHRRLSDMVEIWRMQPRFASRNMTSILKLVNHPRFRAAYDFLMLRAQDGEVNKEIADWWTSFYDTDKKSRVEMARARAKELAAQYRAQRAELEATGALPPENKENKPKVRARKRSRRTNSSLKNSAITTSTQDPPIEITDPPSNINNDARVVSHKKKDPPDSENSSELATRRVAKKQSSSSAIDLERREKFSSLDKTNADPKDEAFGKSIKSKKENPKGTKPRRKTTEVVKKAASADAEATITPRKKKPHRRTSALLSPSKGN